MEQTALFHIVGEGSIKDFDDFNMYLRQGMLKMMQTKNLRVAGESSAEHVRRVYVACGLLQRDANLADLERVLKVIAGSKIIYHEEALALKELCPEYEEELDRRRAGNKFRLVTSWRKEEKEYGRKWDEARLMATVLAKILSERDALTAGAYGELYDIGLYTAYGKLQTLSEQEDQKRPEILKAVLRYFKQYANRNQAYVYDRARKTTKEEIKKLTEMDSEDVMGRAKTLGQIIEYFYTELLKWFMDNKVKVRKIGIDLGDEYKHPLVSRENELFGDGQFILYTSLYSANEHNQLKERIAGAYSVPGMPTLTWVFAGSAINYLSQFHTLTGAGSLCMASMMADWYDKNYPVWGQWVRDLLIKLEVMSRYKYKPTLEDFFKSSYVIPDIKKSGRAGVKIRIVGNLDKVSYSTVIEDRKGHLAVVYVGNSYIEQIADIGSISIDESGITAKVRGGVINSLHHVISNGRHNKDGKDLCIV